MTSKSPDPAQELRPLGAYRLISRIGKGGMGEVFRAYDERLKRHVAIKRIRAEHSFDESARARFRREAQAVARLSHPAIVQIFDVLEGEDGDDNIVMEYLEGESLSDLIQGGGLDSRAAVQISIGIASGLAHAHAKGLVHRDLKPENVIVTEAPGGFGLSWHAKILDFGLARALAGEAIEGMAAPLTKPGAVIGTVHAMSPEQAMGEVVDHRTDLFALGTLLYEMLAAVSPFRGKNWIDTLQRVTCEDPEPLDAIRGDLPPELVSLTMALLEKDPWQRPQKAEEVAEALGRIDVQLAGGTAPGPAPGVGGAAANAFGQQTVSSGIRSRETGLAQVRTLVLIGLKDSGVVEDHLGEKQAQDVADRRLRLESELAKKHPSVAVEEDLGRILLFDRPIEAVSFALAYHQGLAALGDELDVELEARAAVHLGEVVIRRLSVTEVAGLSSSAESLEIDVGDLDLVGRLYSLASARQTLLTRGTFDLARRASRSESSFGAPLHWLAHGAYVFKDLEDPVEVFEIGVEGAAPLMAPEGSMRALRSVAAGDEMVLGWRPAVGLPIDKQPNWTLVERVGEGGFGEVWLARHKSEEMRVFKFCFDSRRLRSLKREVTLFRLLKQALGNRDDIARIIEWDFEQAPYYLASEYTEGGSLVTWSEESGGLETVGLETRVELIAQVGVALSAAHSVGILHKDVKPDNVLVTVDPEGTPRIRLTDFGIGLLTDDTQLDNRVFTIQGMTAGSAPEGEGTQMYMAPELLEGKPPSVQADVYSLGVMLYQVVVGDFQRALAQGWRRDVADDLLADDIAYFVDGRPERRAGSALEVSKRLRSLGERREERLAEQRRQEEEEEARLALERAQRRRQLATMIAGVALLTLAVVLIFAVRERQARTAASREAATSSRITGFLVDLFVAADPFGGTGDVVTVRELLDRGTERVRDELSAEPEVQATMMHTMGTVYKSLGLFAVATPLLEEALGARRQAFGARSPLAAETLQALGEAQCRSGRFEEGEESLREALAIRRSAAELALEAGETLEALGHLCLQFRGDQDGAENALQEALEIHRRLLGPQHPDVAENEHRLALVIARKGRLEEAIGLLHESLASKRQNLGEHPDVARVLINLAHTMWWQGDTGGEIYAREALEISEAKLPGDHPLTAVSLQILGGVLHSAGKLEESEAVHRKGLAMRDRLGDRSFRRASAGFGLAWLLIDQGRFEAAEALVDESLKIYDSEGMANASEVAFARAVKGACLAARGDEAAEAMLVNAHGVLEGAGASSAPYLRATLDWLIRFYEDGDRPRDAAEYRDGTARRS